MFQWRTRPSPPAHLYRAPGRRARLAAIGCGALTVLAATTACTSAGGATACPERQCRYGVGPGLQDVSRGDDDIAGHDACDGSHDLGHVTGGDRLAKPLAQPVPGARRHAGHRRRGHRRVQDVLLFGLGGAALLAGAGSLAYRRRAMRDR